MIAKIKKSLYFPVASYFRFFAAIRLKRWNPKIIVVTGSNGKTTLLHLIESQIGEKARYSHHANSSYGIPFDILDLHRKTLLKSEWIGLIIKTPFNALKSTPKERLYVVEADCDRPGEGKFLSELLKPEIVLWISTAKTHSMNFEELITQNKFPSVEEAIAYEFGYFLENSQEFSIIDGDSVLMKDQVKRCKSKIVEVTKGNSLKSYKVGISGTELVIEKEKYKFKYLLPEEVFYSVIFCKKMLEQLDIFFDQSFLRFTMPPGRGSIFQGVKNTTLIDSTYNANLSSMRAVLTTFEKFSGRSKWLVIADMLEQGKSEKEEHEKLAELLTKFPCERIVLLGPRTAEYIYPVLRAQLGGRIPIDVFEKPRDVLDFILTNIKGGEIILFKGARFLEGVIERLLENKSDIKKLPRREKIWEIRRRQWGL